MRFFAALAFDRLKMVDTFIDEDSFLMGERWSHTVALNL
jgi:hypothetical protein